MELHVISRPSRSAVVIGALIIGGLSLTLGLEIDDSVKKLQPTSIRTQLKVSRSLDPEATEAINVRSNLGGFATIIVKKRNGNNLDNSRRGVVYGDREQETTRLHKVNINDIAPARADYGKWNPISSSVRFADPKNKESLEVINSFMEHIGNIEHFTRQRNGDESGIENDRRPVHIAVSSVKVKDQFANVPQPTVVRSNPVFVKDAQKTKAKRARSLLEVGNDGIPVIEGVRVPDDEDDKRKVWRNARVIKGELVPYENGYVPPKVEQMKGTQGEIIFARETRGDQGRSLGPFTKFDNFRRDEGKGFGPFTISDNIEKQAQPQGRKGGPFFIKDNSRISGSRLIDYIRQINDQNYRNDYFVGRSSVKFNDSPEPQIQRRMLQNSNDFPESGESNTVESVRVPVYEYAHPELGIQPARPPAKDVEKNQQRAQSKVQYYVHNSNLKPYMLDPTLNSQEYVKNDPYYKTSTYPYNYGYLKKVKEQPLWMKISEQVRDSFQNGMTTVEAMTRPVIDPIMEAGQKISHNLGLSKNADYAQNKISYIAPAAGSSLLPALGLMAGGAALGIGAIAVGRFFDGNLLKRSEDIFLTSPEHKRGLENLYADDGVYFFMNPNNEPHKDFNRNKRSTPSSILGMWDVTETVLGSNQRRHKVVRRSLNSYDPDDLGAILQDVENDLPKEMNTSFEDQIRKTDWTNTPCAKKMFCTVMVEQGSDEMAFMEKKIEKILSTMHPLLSRSLSDHIADVTDAIQKGDCSVFVCANH